ncbi:MAG: metallophosphoesterase [Myxococcales bacterium]|nr:metallophosphoesterase [Myxococcales bacterium]
MGRRVQLAIAIYALGHLYIAWRLALPLPSPLWQLTTALFPLCAWTFPYVRMRARRLPREQARPWVLAGYLWFGLVAYLFLGAIASHIAVAAGADARSSALVCGGISIAVVALGLLNVALGPRPRRVRVPMPHLPTERFTIAHITDLHVGALIGREFTQRLVERVNALDTDIIVLTGDIIDGRLSELRDHVEPLRGLRARHGVFMVTGNHEYYWNATAWVTHLRSLGIRVLRNEHTTIDGAIVLAGTDDVSADEDVEAAVAGRDAALPLVLLAHHPRTITRAAEAGVDLQLSGHTHGGQLLPWGWLARLWDPRVRGLGRHGPTWLYVGDGTGYWGPPLRVGTRCEIGLLELRALAA